MPLQTYIIQFQKLLHEEATNSFENALADESVYISQVISDLEKTFLKKLDTQDTVALSNKLDQAIIDITLNLSNKLKENEVQMTNHMKEQHKNSLQNVAKVFYKLDQNISKIIVKISRKLKENEENITNQLKEQDKKLVEIADLSYKLDKAINDSTWNLSNKLKENEMKINAMDHHFRNITQLISEVLIEKINTLDLKISQKLDHLILYLKQELKADKIRIKDLKEEIKMNKDIRLVLIYISYTKIERCFKICSL